MENIRKFKPDYDCYAITDLSGNILGETCLLRINKHWHTTDMSMIIPNPDAQGKGYGIEAGRLMLERAFLHHNRNRISIGAGN